MDWLVQIFLALLDPIILLFMGLFRWMNAPFNLPDKFEPEPERPEPVDRPHVSTSAVLVVLQVIGLTMVLYALFA